MLSGSGNDRMKGGGGGDDMNGGGGRDVLRGSGGRDALHGDGGNDRLSGGGGKDLLDGGAGRDLLRGGTGADVFLFGAARDSVAGAKRDVIVDFEEGIDRIRLSQIDADVDRKGHQAFEFIGGKAYSGDAGELRYAGGRLHADLDGDQRDDMQITVGDGVTLTLDSLLL